ncbi:MAG TPA: dimethylsulfonioproprionate lyase family protein [Kofleriaceae bacterium]|nr:dimethylsulfonioproprionate lyase family protein [Kofleriaceae bacterium]
MIDLLPELALGDLPESERADLERHLQGCATCTGELRAIDETLAELTLALAPVEPDPAVRARILASSRAGRFDGFADAVAGIFDVTIARARELLDLVDEPGAWEPGPGPGTALIHFPAGPACVGADTGFVRVGPGVRFPWHGHHGEETNLVLQGTCRDSTGTTYRRGDVFVHPAGSEHDFIAAEGPTDFVFAVRVLAGVDWDKPGR